MMYIIVALVAIAIIVIMILVKNTRKASIKKQIDDLYVRFNTVKTIPLAFKLSKAQMMAKRNEETASKVQDYYEKYVEAEKHISEIQELLNQIDDANNAKEYREVERLILLTSQKTVAIENEVKDIDSFLEEFSQKESAQRERSTTLKEEYRLIKNGVNSNSNALSISYEGITDKLSICEDLFSQSEEFMYANDYMMASEILDKIEGNLKSLKENVEAIPELIKDTKGVLPLMLDEAKREYALTRQRGVFVEHIDADTKFDGIDKNLNEDLKKLVMGEVDGIKDDVAASKDILNDLMETFERENRAFKEARETNEKINENIGDLEKIENYVRIAYDKDSARFGLENLKETLRKQRESIETYRRHYQKINEDIASCFRPSTDILDEVINLATEVELDKKSMYSYKTIIDKSTDGEVRAQAQLVKLQVVISEVQTKVKEYHLPTISKTYELDLIKSKEYVNKIKNLLTEIPLGIDELNVVLDEAIDFVYKFYNNVNNIVGMAIMVENAIVFGNKYRSTYPEIDRELSKAEFQYLNGEYTKALRTAITCMEELFPDNPDKILENA